MRCFEWFKCRTAKKIPGLFVLTFWNTLLFQASLEEPAVLHAVLTLSSVHKREIFHGNAQSRSEDNPDEQEHFMLQQYIKAIRHLQPHFSAKDRASVRVALITCVVFVCLELLHGHFTTAQTHLQNGLKVLMEMQIPTRMDNDNDLDKIFISNASCDSIDNWIAEAFSRLYVQVELFGLSYQHPCFVLQVSRPESSVATFHSINEAWQQIERLLHKIVNLAEQARQHQISKNVSSGYPSTLLRHQQHIQAELAWWLETYEAARRDLQIQEFEGFAYLMLCTYHAMAEIMAGACLRPDDESIYDSYTKKFVFLINQSAKNWSIRSSNSQVRALPGHHMNMSRSIVDIGWIPPLYYVALKCRVHRVRIQAVRLLESTSHREGIWDSKIAACVGRKVVLIEERDFYRNAETADDFPLSSSPGLEDLSLPTLPQSYRIQQVKVILPNSPTNNVFMFYNQIQTDGDWRVFMKEYHVSSQCWTDVRTDEETEI